MIEQSQFYYGKITADNYNEYIRNLRAESKKNLDAAGITAENVSRISKYADEMYTFGKYDEVEAEYNTFKALKR